MTTAFIIVSAVLIFSLFLNHRQTASIRRLTDKVRELKYELAIFEEDGKCRNPHYIISTLNDGLYAVKRITWPDEGRSVESVIKVFDTEDKIYNINCAVELVNKLNEALCYD